MFTSERNLGIRDPLWFPTLRLCQLLLLGLLCLIQAGCSRSGGSAETALAPASPALATDLQQLIAPPDVNEQLWDELKTQLAIVLEQHDSLRRASSPPLPAELPNQLAFNAGSGRIEWGYYSPGDYDQNGLVTISDLTPLAVHLGKQAAGQGFPQNSIEAVVDGDGNGEINIADITPIGIHFNTECQGYRVYMSPSQSDYPPGNTAANGPGAVLAAEISFSEAQEAAGLRKQFSHPRGDFAEAQYFWVRPFQGSQEGTASNALLVQPGSNQAPVAQLSATPQNGPVPLRVRYGAIGSSDVDGEIVSYDWDFDSNGEPEDSWADPQQRDFYFYTPGEYSVTLRVTDDDGAIGEKTVLINAQPGAEWHHEEVVSAAYENVQPYAGTRIFDVDLTEANGTPAIAYSMGDYINWGDLGIESVYFRRAANAEGSKWGAAIMVDQVEYSARRINGVKLHTVNDTPYLMYNVGTFSMSTVKYDKFASLAENSIGLNWPAGQTIFESELVPSIRIHTYQGKMVFFGGEDPDSPQRLFFAQDETGSIWSDAVDPYPQLPEKWPYLAVVNDRLAFAFSDYISENIYQLMYTRAVDDTGLVWPTYPKRVAPLELSARRPVLVVTDGRPGIAYNDVSLDTLKWIHSADPDGVEWGESQVLDAWTGGRQSLMLYGDRPAILYSNYVMEEWRVIIANDPAGASWSFPMSVSSYLESGPTSNTQLEFIGGNLCFAWEQIADTEDHYGSKIIFTVYH